jgi:3-deoxy-manno-octulosonate cytidylyltransferase (CMP-KDO synthetase)
VKVVTDQNGFALYFSRSVIPTQERNVGVRYMQHWDLCLNRPCLTFTATHEISIREARAIALLEFEDESMIETTHVGIGIDTPEDLERLEECFSTAYFLFF